MAPAERARLLWAVAAEPRGLAEEAALLECRDTGKPLAVAQGEAAGAARRRRGSRSRRRPGPAPS